MPTFGQRAEDILEYLKFLQEHVQVQKDLETRVAELEKLVKDLQEKESAKDPFEDYFKKYLDEGSPWKNPEYFQPAPWGVPQPYGPFWVGHHYKYKAYHNSDSSA